MHVRLLLSVVVVLALCFSMAVTTPGANQAEESESKVLQLLTERRDTVRELRDTLNASYISGQTEYTTVVEVEDELLEAELDLAISRADRLAIHEDLVENRKRTEELLQQRFKLGAALTTEVLYAKAARLKAEIDLQRERSASQ